MFQEIPTHMPDHVEHTDVLWQAMINKKQQIVVEHQSPAFCKYVL